MSANENASLRKQLLDAKSTIAELQEDGRRLERKIVDLEATLITKEQTISSLTAAQKTFEASLHAERERIHEEYHAIIIKDKEEIQQLEKRVGELEHEMAVLATQRDSYKFSLEDYEKRFSSLFANSKDMTVAKETNIQDIFNYEIKEKQKLSDKIFELTQKLNEADRLKNALEQENRKYRNEFGVPTNFVHSDDLRKNQVTRIGFLEREIETLEEERAELKCKLRQMAAFVSPNSFEGEAFSQLNQEQREALCLYAVNLLSGKKDFFVDGNTQDLAKKCDKLIAENEMLKKDNEQKHQAMLELAKNFKHLSSGSLTPAYNVQYPQSINYYTQPAQNNGSGMRPQSLHPTFVNQSNPGINIGGNSGSNGMNANYITPIHQSRSVPYNPNNLNPSHLKLNSMNSSYFNQVNEIGQNFSRNQLDENDRSGRIMGYPRNQEAFAQPKQLKLDQQTHGLGKTGNQERVDVHQQKNSMGTRLMPSQQMSNLGTNLDSRNFLPNSQASFNNFTGADIVIGQQDGSQFNLGIPSSSFTPDLPLLRIQIPQNDINGMQNPTNVDIPSMQYNQGYYTNDQGQYLQPQNGDQIYNQQDIPYSNHSDKQVHFSLGEKHAIDLHNALNQQDLNANTMANRRALLQNLRYLKSKLSSENISMCDPVSQNEMKIIRQPEAEVYHEPDHHLIYQEVDDRVIVKEFQNMKTALEDQIKLYSAEIQDKNRQIETLEHQNAQIRRFVDAVKKGDPQEEQAKILRANEELMRNIGKMNREGEIYRSKIELMAKRMAELEEELLATKEMAKKTNRFDKSYTDRLNAIIANLLEKLENSVPLREYKDLVFKAENLQQQLINAQTESVYNCEVQAAFKTLHKDYMSLAHSHSSSLKENLNLLCEFQLIDARLSDVDDDYFNFKSLIKRLIEGVRDKDLCPNDFLSKFMNETLSDKLTSQNLATIFMHFGVRLFESDLRALQTFLMADKQGSVFKEDFLRKVSIFSMDFYNLGAEDAPKATPADLNKLIQTLENCELSSEELFKMFDYKSIGVINIEDISAGLVKLGMEEIDVAHLKEELNRVFFVYDSKIDIKTFIKSLQSYTQNNWKKNLLTQKELPWEIEIGKMLNEFLVENKSQFPGPRELFRFIDVECRGYLLPVDFEFFFKNRVGLEIDNRRIENLYVSIDKDINSQGINEYNFAQFLKKCQLFSRVNEKISSPDNTKVLTNGGQRGRNEFSSQGFELKLNLLKGEISNNEFKMKQLNVLLLQSKEQLSLLEKKDSDNVKLISMYKTEIAKLYDELHETQMSKSSDKPNTQNQKQPDWWNVREEITLQEMEKTLHNIQAQNELLKQENSYLTLRMQRTEEDALSIFMATAKAAAEKEVDICQLLKDTYHTTQQYLLEQKLKESNSTIDKLEIQIQEIELQSIEDRIRAQNYIENLADKITALQQTLAQNDRRRIPVVDAEQVSKLSSKIQELSHKIAKYEDDCKDLAMRNKNLEIALVKTRIDRETAITIKNLSKHANEPQMLEKLKEVILESKNLKMDKMKLEKELAFELNTHRSLQTALQSTQESIAKLEAELQKQIESSANRELFWSDKYQKVLNANLELKQMEGASSKRAKISSEAKHYANIGEPSSLQNLVNAPQNNHNIFYETQELSNLKQELNKVSSENEFLKKMVKQQSTIQEIDKETPRTYANNVDRFEDRAHLISTAQTAVNVIQGLLDVKQAELSDSQKEVRELKDQLFDLQQKYEILKLTHDHSQSELHFNTTQFQMTGVHSVSSEKPQTKSKEVEFLKAREKALSEEIAQLKKMNRELVEKIRAGIALKPVTPKQDHIHTSSHLEDKLNEYSRQVSDLTERLRQAEDTIHKKEKENNSLFETIKSLKNDLLEQSKLVVSEKMTVEQRKGEAERIKNEFDGKLKISAKRIKELTIKLKELTDEIVMLRDKNCKHEENVKRLNKENVDLNLALMKKHEEIVSLKAKVEKKPICPNCENKKDEFKEAFKENETLTGLKSAKPVLKKASTELIKPAKPQTNEPKTLLPPPSDLKVDLKRK